MDAESEFAHRLAKKVAEEVASLAEQLVNGYAEGFDDYRHRVGRIAGLRQAAEMCREVDREMR